MKRETAQTEPNEYATGMLPVCDCLEILHGRWTLAILCSLSSDSKRFSRIARDLPGISDRMLSKELKVLEANKIVTRTVYEGNAPVIEYSVTPYGHSLDKVIDAMRNWGLNHRRVLSNK
jgi:DNA-binding HxlR family transcriptional regulator